MKLPAGATFAFVENVPNGHVDEVTTPNVTATANTASVTFKNHKIVSLDIVKTADEGSISGVPFTVNEWNNTNRQRPTETERSGSPYR